MRIANYLQTNDNKTVDYNNDTKLDDLSTVEYNSNADVDKTKPMTIKPKTSVTQQQAKKIKKYKSLKRKGQPITYIKNNKKAKTAMSFLYKRFLYILEIDLQGLQNNKKKRKKLNLQSKFLYTLETC